LFHIWFVSICFHTFQAGLHAIFTFNLKCVKGMVKAWNHTHTHPTDQARGFSESESPLKHCWSLSLLHVALNSRVIVETEKNGLAIVAMLG
jgi:hypothetical protein